MGDGQAKRRASGHGSCNKDSRAAGAVQVSVVGPTTSSPDMEELEENEPTDDKEEVRMAEVIPAEDADETNEDEEIIEENA